jgi:hypothetical protein
VDLLKYRDSGYFDGSAWLEEYGLLNRFWSAAMMLRNYGNAGIEVSETGLGAWQPAHADGELNEACLKKAAP